MKKIFTPTYADKLNNNAQNLTVKSIISRLDHEEFKVLMLSETDDIDPRLSSRQNFDYIKLGKHHKTIRIIYHFLRFRPDIYFYPLMTHVDLLCIAISNLLNPKMKLATHVVHTVDENHQLALTKHSKKLKYILSKSNYIAGNSKFVSQTLKEFMQIKSSIVHNGIERHIFYPLDLNTRNKVKKVLFVGSFQERKRPDMVIKTAKNFPNLEFQLIGDGEMKNYCLKLTKELQCKNVKFSENLSQNEVADQMRSADIFLLPSIHEGHPQVLGQASTCGCVCIAMSNYRPDYILNKVTGFLVDNDQEITEKIELLIESPSTFESMRKKSIEHMKSFDWDYSAEIWSKAFKSMYI